MSSQLAELKEGNGQGALIWSLEILLVVAFSFFLAEIFWTLFGGNALLPKVPDTQQKVLSVKTSHQAKDLDAVLKHWHPFGELKTAPISRSANNTVTAYKNGDLTLIGLFASNDNRLGWAIIAKKGKPDHLYFVGDRLPGHLILTMVNSDSVLLKSGHGLERLTLESFSEDGILPPDSAQKKGHSGKPVALSKHDKLIQYLGLKAISSDAPEGYLVTSKSKRLITQFKLKPGDKILTANGYPLGTAEADQTAFSSLAALGKAEIVVQRGNQQIFIDYNNKNRLR